MRTQGAAKPWIDDQHGVISHEQLVAAGWDRDAIKRALRAGWLRPLFRGVYAAGHTALRREGWWMAALLVCGEDAALSHRSAAAKWRLRRGDVAPIHLTSPGARGRKHDAIVLHQIPLGERDVITFDGLRITAPARTIVDATTGLPPRARRELIERAQDVGHFDSERIRAAAHNRRGVRNLVDLLDLLEPDADNARSHLERLFLPLTRALARPLVNHEIAGRKRDFVFPDQRLVVEVDGYAYHSSRTAMRRDRARDRELTALGWRPARFTYEEVAFEPDEVRQDLRLLITSAN